MRYLFFIIVIIIFILLLILYKSFHFPVLIRKAEELMDEEDFTRANSIVKKILDRKRDYVPARYLKAKILKQQGQYLLSISEFNSILAITDFIKFIKELDIHYQLAELYNLTQNWQKEIEEYRVILTFNPDDITSNHRIGHAHFRRQEYKKTREHLLKAVSFDPKLNDCNLPLGISCYHTSDYTRAEEFLHKSLKDPGENTEAEYYLGSIYKMKKDYDNAVIMLDASKKNSAYFTKSLYKLGEIFHEQEEYKKAMEYLEQGLNFIDESSDSANQYRYLLAECLEHENMIKEAVYHWEKIASQNPNYRSTNHKLKSYKEIIRDSSLMSLFTASLDELQDVIVELISSLNYNIVNNKKISPNEYMYRAFNIKRINDPPLLIYFNRTTKEITEGQITDFYKQISSEKCKSGMYIATSKFSLKAKSTSTSKMIELYDSEFVINSVEKINAKKKSNKIE